MSQNNEEPTFPEENEILIPGDENLGQAFEYNPEDIEMINDDSDDEIIYDRVSTPDPDNPPVEEEEPKKEEEVQSPLPPGIDASLYDDKEDNTEEEDDDDESDDEDSLKKLERDIDHDKLIESHPEIIQNNYNEILALCNIVRNDKGLIVDDLHRTYPFISKYEYARIVGIRAKQLNNGADPFIKVARGVIDGFTIAKLEMDAKKVPFIIARPLPNGSREYWKVQDLEMIHF
jgi:DNA-directed RNA polymerase subunit K/omega